MQSLVRFLTTFVVMFIVNGAMAAAVIGPLLEDRYRSVVADAPNVGFLIAGYGLIAIVLVLLHRALGIGETLPQSATIGLAIGLAIFAGTHAVQAGYTNIDPFAWTLSGILDSAGPTAGMVALAAVARRQQDAT